MDAESGEDLSPRGLGAVWFALFITEFTLMFIMNALTLTAFARNRHLRKRSTYLMINLTVADFLVGAVSGPMHIYHIVTFDAGSGISWQKFIVLTFDNLFTASSMANLSLISLERLHATIYPFKHRLIRKSVYFKIVVSIWIFSLIPAFAESFLFLEMPFASKYLWGSFISLSILIQTISYVSILVKVRRSTRTQQFGLIASERKLSVTLLITTFASTMGILPCVFYGVFHEELFSKLPISTRFFVAHSVDALFFASSLVNPLIYAIRMQSFRKALCSLLTCRRTAESTQDQITELDAM